tara:strand:- start:68 stop:949 length:882 start_codon:yes stop_codon:yes gene_type:complete
MRTQIEQVFTSTRQSLSRTNISVELVKVTPLMAENFLKYNPVNRKVSQRNVSFLSKQMEKGLFLENGESIVFDKNNILKDGQHRLMAIIKSGKSYHIPIVRGVVSSSMATYDTGKNRSAGDVLSIAGFKSSSTVSALIKNIDKYFYRGSKCAITGSTNRTETLSNQEILENCKDNYDWLIELVNNSANIYNKSSLKTLSVTNLSLIAYMIGGEKPSKEVYSFLKHLIGVSRTEETATSYLYGKIYNSKVNKEPLNFYWILGMSIKAWNYYSDGNPSVRYFKFQIDQELPKVNK